LKIWWLIEGRTKAAPRLTGDRGKDSVRQVRSEVRMRAALRSGLEAVIEALRFHTLFHGAAREARAHLVVAAQLRFRGQRFVLRGALAARGGAMLCFSARIDRHASLLGGRRHALVVKAALVHGVGLADENMGGHFVFRAAELTERRQKNQIIKRFGG